MSIRDRPPLEKPTHHLIGDYVSLTTWNNRVYALTRYWWIYELDVTTKAFRPCGHTVFQDGEQALGFVCLDGQLLALSCHGRIYELTIEGDRCILTFVSERTLPEIGPNWTIEVRGGPPTAIEGETHG